MFIIYFYAPSIPQQTVFQITRGKIPIYSKLFDTLSCNTSINMDDFPSHQDTETYIVAGTTVDEMQSLMDDHIIKVQTMKGAGEVGEGEILVRKMGGKEA